MAVKGKTSRRQLPTIGPVRSGAITTTPPRSRAHPDAFTFAVHYVATIRCAKVHSYPLADADGVVIAFPCDACTAWGESTLGRMLKPALNAAVRAATKPQRKT